METPNISGGGSGLFAVPDLRGEFLRCTGTNPRPYSGSGGPDVGVHQDATKHTYYRADGSSVWICYTSGMNGARDYDYQSTNAYVINNGSGGGKAYNWPGWFTSRPTNTSVKMCIRVK